METVLRMVRRNEGQEKGFGIGELTVTQKVLEE